MAIWSIFRQFGKFYDTILWSFGLFCGYLVYFVVLCYILWSFGLFCGHLVYFVVIRYILLLFVTFCGHLLHFVVICYILWSFVIFCPFWYSVPRKSGNPAPGAPAIKFFFSSYQGGCSAPFSCHENFTTPAPLPLLLLRWE
jgi:hypothetical protein